MTITYHSTLDRDLDKVRFYLQDTVNSSGPKPADGNFTDDELSALVTVEGAWQRAVAAGFEALASAWRKYPSFTADGLKLDRSNIADGYDAKAKEWRKLYGTSVASKTGGAGSRAVTRVDGYSSDIDGHTV